MLRPVKIITGIILIISCHSCYDWENPPHEDFYDFDVLDGPYMGSYYDDFISTGQQLYWSSDNSRIYGSFGSASAEDGGTILEFSFHYTPNGSAVISLDPQGVNGLITFTRPPDFSIPKMVSTHGTITIEYIHIEYPELNGPLDISGSFDILMNATAGGGPYRVVGQFRDIKNL